MHVLFSGFAGLMVLGGCAHRGEAPEVDSVPSQGLTESESLLSMREEEKLARDIYLKSASLWDLPLFEHIAESEQRHMDAVLRLMERRGLTDPTSGKGPGEFTDARYTQLYEELAERSERSELEALRVGVAIEELDIEDLAAHAEQLEAQDMLRVYANLERASRNHLRHFVGALEERGEVVEPGRLSSDEFAAIVSSEPERGGGGGGCGHGGGGDGGGGHGRFGRGR